jgi:thaumarchaeosortase
MADIFQTVRKKTQSLLRVAPVLSFVIPFAFLYFYQNLAYPLYEGTFEMTWKGRTFYIFFVWLAMLEVIMNWEKLRGVRICKLRSLRTIAFAVGLMLPALYLFVSNYLGLNSVILKWANANGVAQSNWMPLSVEYLVLAILFVLIIVLEYGVKGLEDFSISPIFLAAIGLVYTIDNVYMYGSFSPFQILVPAAATMAATMLSFMGYQVQWKGESSETPVLRVENSRGAAEAGIAWPCSGIESLIIYSVTILLFLRSMAIPLRQKVVYFVIGAVVTFFINVLRIVSIFVIAVDNADVGGIVSAPAQLFHNYYGQLYSIAWIIFYPLIIVGSRFFWGKIMSLRNSHKLLLEGASGSNARGSKT